MVTGDLASTTDEELLRQIQEGRSHAAFSTLVRRHANKFRQTAYRFVANKEEAEDIVQNAFLKLWDRPTMYNPDSGAKFTTWFYRVITNECLDQKRKHKPVAIQEGEEFEDTHPIAEEILMQREQASQVENAFRALRPDMQTSLNLSFYEKLPNKEAADIMGLSLKAFQSLLMRAKKTLKDTMMAQENSKQKSARHYGSH